MPLVKLLDISDSYFSASSQHRSWRNLQLDLLKCVIECMVVIGGRGKGKGNNISFVSKKHHGIDPASSSLYLYYAYVKSIIWTQRDALGMQRTLFSPSSNNSAT